MTELKTQGTQLFYVSGPTASSEIGNIIDFTPPAPNSDEIEVTNMSDTAKRFLQGLRDYGEGSFQINWDPTNVSHQGMQTLFAAGTVTEFLIGFSDGTTAAPTVTASAFAAPATTRSWVKFAGYVKSISTTGSKNDVVKATLTIRNSGTPTYVYKA